MICGAEKFLLSYEDCYLSAQNDKSTLEWNREAARGMEKFTITYVDSNRVAFKTKHNLFVSAHRDGVVDAKARAIGNEEIFTIREISPGTYSAETAHGTFLSASNGNIRCHSKLFDESILIRVHPYISFEGYGRTIASCHKKFLSVQPNGSLEWNRPKAQGWERFDTVSVDGKWAFRGWQGKYMSIARGAIDMNADKIGPKECFEVIVVGQGKFAIKTANGKWLTVTSDGKIRWDTPKLQAWEEFDISW
jgi:hypothetical protein